MGMSTPHVLGWDTQYHVKRQSAFATAVNPTDSAPGSFLATAGDGESKQALIARKVASAGSRITPGWIKGHRETTFGLTGELVPSGAAGTAPDIGPLLRQAYGVETIDTGVSVIYSLGATQGAAGANTILQCAPKVFSRKWVGAIVTDLKITQKSGEPPVIAINGGAADLVFTGRSTVSAHSGTLVTPATADLDAFEVGSIVGFWNPSTGAQVDTNSGNGYVVTARNASTGELTLDGSPTISNGNVIAAFAPDADYNGAPRDGVTGSLTLNPGSGAVTIPGITGIEVALKTGYALHPSAFSATPLDYTERRAEVTAKITARLRVDMIRWIGGSKSAPTRTHAFVLTWGDTAGSIVKAKGPAAQLHVVGQKIPEEDEAEVEIQVAFGDSELGANDAATLEFT